MRHSLLRWLAPLCLALVVVLAESVRVVTAAKPTPLSPERLQAVAAMLPAKPVGIGRPINDRAAWQEVARRPEMKHIVGAAEQLLAEPIPELTEELYLDYSRTGVRHRCERVQRARHDRVVTLTMAECIENRGRFLPALEEAIRAVCAERSWLWPAHDYGQQTFYGRGMLVDLHSAATSWNLATSAYWLGDKLTPEVRSLIASEMERRTLAPYESYLNDGAPKLRWMTCTNNWNAVCLAGVTGTALATVESPERRATYVVAAETYIQNFFRGFTPDGYCSEGVGYYNYGFGHFVLLSETLLQATAGRVDLFAGPHVRQIARFGPRMEIISGIYPPFADCSPQARPNPALLAYLSHRFDFGWKEIERQAATAEARPRSLFELGIEAFPTFVGQVKATPTRPASCPVSDADATAETPLREWFADAGVLICRPAGMRASVMGVALKGGHNAEHHNHNDLGSFVVAWRGATPLVDPGAEVYTARTFSSKRYDSKLLNSYGHAVPLVAGQLQRTGREAAARILKTEFTDAQDTLVMDLTSAYAVKELKQLQRTFRFSRQGDGQLTVIDEVEFDSPQSFGTALITFSPERKILDRAIVIGSGRDALRIAIDAGAAEIKISQNEIEEDIHGKVLPVRFGIDLAKPATRAQIRLTIQPDAGA
jgi:hypothetical protein